MERFAIKIDKKLKANLYKICRLCGIDNPEMVPILTCDDQNESVAEAMDVDAEPEMPQKIKLLIGLVVTKDDRMPQTMCSLCVDKINDFYEFREMCYATNTQTRKLLGLKNIKKAVPDVKPKVEVKEEETIIPKNIGKGFKSLSGTSARGSTALKEEEPIIPKITGKGFKTSSTTSARGPTNLKEEEPIIPKTTGKGLKALSNTSAKGSTALKEEEPTMTRTTGKGLKTLSNTSMKGLANAKGLTNARGLTNAKGLPIAKGITNLKGLKSAVLSSTAAKLLARDSRKRKQEEPEEIQVRESRKRKQEEPPLPPPLPKKEPVPPAVSNKKLRLAAVPLKEAATKKAKLKNKEEPKDVEVKEEIKVEPKEEKPPPPPPPPIIPAPTVTAIPPANNKLKQACTICSERFATKAKLEAHTRLQHIPKIDRYVCTACNETISKSFDIKNHQLWHKLSKTPYICGLCGESIVSTYAYARHVREHCFETPPAFLVLDRECPQCHVSYATNYLYNTHPCAVKAKRCAGCNRLQRSDTEFIKHSALCAKVYLNYSKHIMPAVEAQEDEVRIKNENDVEAAAEEMARLTGMPLDMAPVVQLTRLSSPLIMAANQCVSIPGIEDSPSTSSKKPGKKGVSKKELKRVDELLKSTLDALVSIKHEPEVHVDTEPPPAEGDQGDNGGHGVDDNPNMDVGFQEEDDSDHEVSTKDEQCTEVPAANPDGVEVKQEVEETHEAPKPEDAENASKLTSGGGLKLKIRKEHGQLNSSIIEQQKSVEKRAEKRKKKKKHKDKVKDKLKLQKEQQEDQNSLDSFNTQHNEDNISSAESPAAVRIKAEPVDEIDNDASAVSAAQGRPQPEATIMTSIPMMQLQIACISEGVDFNGANATTAVEDPQINHEPAAEVTEAAVTVSTKETDHEDVKPNRVELDRMLKISHVSSGIAMETDDIETEFQMDHDGVSEDDHQSRNDEEEDEQHNKDDDGEDEQNDDKDTAMFTPMEKPTPAKAHSGVAEEPQQQPSETISKPIKPKLIKQKPAPKIIPVKSRNKACKSTAKPSVHVPIPPVLQISSIQSGVSLSLPTESAQNDFTPVFIKPEPQNRGYSDEPPPPPPPIPSPPSSPALSQDKPDEIAPAMQETQEHQEINKDEQVYISSIDFNNITIKQEKDLEINDVQISANKAHYCKYSFNGIKKRKVVRRVKKKNESISNDEDLVDPNENLKDDTAEEDDVGEEEEVEEEASEEEEDEEQDEEEQEYDEEEEEEEEEEREYRELEYPPELKTQDEVQDEEDEDDDENEENEDKSAKEDKLSNNFGEEDKETKNEQDNNSPGSSIPASEESVASCEQDSLLKNESPPIAIPEFVISSVCSHASDSGETTDITEASNQEPSVMLPPLAFNKSTESETTPDETKFNETQDSLMTSEPEHIENLQLVEQTHAIADPYQGLEPAFEQKSPVLKIVSVTSGIVSDLQHPPDQFSIQQENQTGVNNVDNVAVSELEIVGAVSHNVVEEQCAETNVLHDTAAETQLNVENTEIRGSELKANSLSEFNTPVAGGSEVISEESEQELLPCKTGSPEEVGTAQREICQDEIELNRTDEDETLTDKNYLNYHQSTENTMSTPINRVGTLTDRSNLVHQSETPVESNFAAQTTPFELLGGMEISDFALQGQSTTSTEVADTAEYMSQGYVTAVSEANDSTCQNSMKPVADIADDTNPTNVATSQYQQETPFAEFEQKNCLVLKESETSVGIERANVDSTRNAEDQELITNALNENPTEITNQVSAMESETTSIPCVSHNKDTVPSGTLECTRSETIEGIVVETNDMQLEAKPFLNLQENVEHSCANQEEENEIDEDEDEDEDYEEDNYEDEEVEAEAEADVEVEEEEDVEDEDEEKEEDDVQTNHEPEPLVDSNLNLEEEQNQQNQQQQQEDLSELARPTALALHPYLEDISSSSNSFLSNTLSQTPPPTQSTSNNSYAQPAPSHHSEETENILNESSDVLSRRPSFNFDNINEIAENNNNANLEREQLQDDQQQQNDVT